MNWEKFKTIIDLEKKLEDLSTQLKITHIRSISIEKSKSKVRERKSMAMREKTRKGNEIL